MPCWCCNHHTMCVQLTEKLSSKDLHCDLCRSSPQQSRKEAFDKRDRSSARMKPMRSLPGEGTGEASENIGAIQANTNASRRLRVLSVRHLP